MIIFFFIIKNIKTIRVGSPEIIHQGLISYFNIIFNIKLTY